MTKRGQAAMEYLFTYGWVFLGIVIVLGGLAYFGILNPARFLPERCEFSPGAECRDFQIKQDGTGGADIGLTLYNSFGTNIQLNNVTLSSDVFPEIVFPPGICSPAPPYTLYEAETFSFTCKVQTFAGAAGSKISVKVNIGYNAALSTNTHTLAGEIYATVIEFS